MAPPLPWDRGAGRARPTTSLGLAAHPLGGPRPALVAALARGAAAALVAVLLRGGGRRRGGGRGADAGGAGTDGGPEAPVFLRCPVTLEPFVDPVVVVETGHTCERAAAERWFAGRPGAPTDPTTGAALRSTALVPNWALRDAVADWRKRNGLPPLPSPGSASFGGGDLPGATGSAQRVAQLLGSLAGVVLFASTVWRSGGHHAVLDVLDAVSESLLTLVHLTVLLLVVTYVLPTLFARRVFFGNEWLRQVSRGYGAGG